ncbi:MAG: hypothetical protein MR598_05950 [Erysipelotrichaceae bacterium]|nr:hypothetical protein [Erysipelotrichaceae bacterium]
MKEKVDNIKKFLKENYKLIIPITLMIVLFIAFLIYYKVSISNNYHIDTEEKVYQYFYDKKYEYTATISKNKKGVIIDFKPQEIKVNLDSTPIYYQKKNIVILPKDMSVVMPTLSCAEYLTTGYSYITYQDGIYNLTTNRYHKKLNHYFLYDGSDLYFFIEPVTLTINEEQIQLTPFSYVIAKYNKYISYYDRKTDTFKTITTTENNAKIENEYYTVYISKDTIDYQGTNIILTSDIKNLNTIDKKD